MGAGEVGCFGEGLALVGGVRYDGVNEKISHFD